jgi:drug/metabolite transporter (DMT)-like permease
MFKALRYTSALNTSVLYTLVPGLAGIFGALLIHERLGRHRLYALCCGMIGALWVIFRGDIGRLVALDFNRGDIIFLVGCLSMGLYTPLIKMLHRDEPMTLMTFWVLVTGVGWLLLASGFNLFEVPWRQVETYVWAGIIYLAIFTTIITFFLTQFATIRIGPTRVMAYSYFYPLFVLVIDWFTGRGFPPMRILPGILIVLAATFVLQRGAEKYPSS